MQTIKDRKVFGEGWEQREDSPELVEKKRKLILRGKINIQIYSPYHNA